MAEALYRKYRPQVFEDVVGQEHIERTIKNAIDQDKVSHAYLFTGPRGTGKTTTARLLAKALLCEKGPTPEPDGTCADCEMIAAGEHPDVYELDAASRTGVENVREEIIGRVQFAPTRGRYKIYIIDEVHMLSTAAFNALLKTLEEPPSHVVFILATTDPQKVPETIHSRCQRFDFRRISNESIVSRLGAICVAEGVEFEGDALELVAHRAEGGMRNALTSLEQLIAFGEGRVTMEVAERMLGSLDSSDLAEIVGHIGRRDVAACFRWTAEYVESGADLAQFTRDLAEHMRNMYVMSLSGADIALDVTETARRELVAELPLYGPDRLARMLGVLGDLCAELKTSTNQRLSFEIALTRMVRPESDLTLESLAERIEALEAGHSVAQPIVVMEDNAGRSAQFSGSVRPLAAGSADAAASFDAQSCHAANDSRTEVRFASNSSSGLSTKETLADSANNVANCNHHVEGSMPAEPVDATTGASEVSDNAVTAQVIEGLRNPAALQRMWQTAMAQLKKAKAAYGVLFLNTKAVLDEANKCLVIEFPAANDFAFKAVQKPDVQKELSAALGAACGVALSFEMVKASGSNRSAAAGPVDTVASSATQSCHIAEESRTEVRFASASSSGLNIRETLVDSANNVIEPVQQQPEPAPWEDQVPVDVYGFVCSDETSEPVDAAAFSGTHSYHTDEIGSTKVKLTSTSPSGVSIRETLAGSVKNATNNISSDDINAALAFGFGEGISFTEVNE